MTSKKRKSYDVPTVKHNRRKTDQYKFKSLKFKRTTDLLPIAESNYITLKKIQKELSKINKRISKLEEPEEIWIDTSESNE